MFLRNMEYFSSKTTARVGSVSVWREKEKEIAIFFLRGFVVRLTFKLHKCITLNFLKFIFKMIKIISVTSVEP